MLDCAFGHAPEHPRFRPSRKSSSPTTEACLTDARQVYPRRGGLIQRLRDTACTGWSPAKHSRFTPATSDRRPCLCSPCAQTVVSGDTDPARQAHPAPLLEAAARLDLPQQCLYGGRRQTRHPGQTMQPGMPGINQTAQSAGCAKPISADRGATPEINTHFSPLDNCRLLT